MNKGALLSGPENAVRGSCLDPLLRPNLLLVGPRISASQDQCIILAWSQDHGEGTSRPSAPKHVTAVCSNNADR